MRNNRSFLTNKRSIDCPYENECSSEGNLTCFNCKNNRNAKIYKKDHYIPIKTLYPYERVKKIDEGRIRGVYNCGDDDE